MRQHVACSEYTAEQFAIYIVATTLYRVFTYSLHCRRIYADGWQRSTEDWLRIANVMIGRRHQWTRSGECRRLYGLSVTCATVLLCYCATVLLQYFTVAQLFQISRLYLAGDKWRRHEQAVYCAGHLAVMRCRDISPRLLTMSIYT